MMAFVTRLVVALLALAAVACTPISAIEGNRTAAPGAAVQRIHVASVRASRFAQERASTSFAPVSYSAYDVAVPPAHVTGLLPKYSTGTGLDPDDNFISVARRDFAGGAAFARAAAGGRAPFILVHGFNTSFELSITTQAQMAHDLQLPMPQVVYAWPSGTSLLTYEEDQQRAAAAVDGLVDLLRLLRRPPGQGPTVLAGYSMGGTIVMRALQRLRGEPALLARLEVVLFGPDMDRDAFAAVARSLPPLARPITVLGTRRDKALRLARLTYAEAGHQLGHALSAADLPDLPLTFVEMADVRHRGSGHFALLSYPPLIEKFTARPGRDIADFAASLALLPGAAVSRNGRATYIRLPEME